MCIPVTVGGGVIVISDCISGASLARILSRGTVSWVWNSDPETSGVTQASVVLWCGDGRQKLSVGFPEVFWKDLELAHMHQELSRYYPLQLVCP